MTSRRKFFGTDGIRGPVGTSPLTPDFALKLGWAAGKVLLKNGSGEVLLGKDTRLSGYMFESALEAGFAAAGASVRFLGPLPTPAVAYLTRTFRAAAGVVISASHNPYTDNGFKFFAPDGYKLSDAQELEIEAYLSEALVMNEGSTLGKAHRSLDAGGRYIEYIKASVPINLSFEAMNIVLDCANGAAYKVAPAALRELGANVHCIGIEPDGLNINRDVGATDVAALREAVLEHSADIGIALDGDADRVIMLDHSGAEVDGDAILYLLAADARRRHQALDGVVGTKMSNLGLETALRNQFDLPMLRAEVGDRYVIELMRANGWQLGGESSGHIILADRSTTGDGLMAAIQVMISMRREQASLQDLLRDYRAYPQKMINLQTKDKATVMSDPDVAEAVAAAEANLGQAGRVLLRPSGTEAKIRVMVEAESSELACTHCEAIAEVVRAKV